MENSAASIHSISKKTPKPKKHMIPQHSSSFHSPFFFGRKSGALPLLHNFYCYAKMWQSHKNQMAKSKMKKPKYYSRN